MAIYKDLGRHFPVYQEGQVPKESQYWKRIFANAKLNDNYTVFGGCELDDGGTAATADMNVLVVSLVNLWVKGIYAVFTAGAITGQDTNYKSINIVNRGAAGLGTDEVASIDFKSGTNATQYAPNALTLSGTAANLLIDSGEVVTAEYAKTGDGLALNESNIFMVAEPMVETANKISDESVLFVAPHRMYVEAAYATFLESAVTGANTNYAEIDIINLGVAGSGATKLAEEAFTSGVDAMLNVPVALTLNSTASNLVIERGDVVVARLVKAGAGMEVGEVSVGLVVKAIE